MENDIKFYVNPDNTPKGNEIKFLPPGSCSSGNLYYKLCSGGEPLSKPPCSSETNLRVDCMALSPLSDSNK